jgi:hypothetical protein
MNTIDKITVGLGFGIFYGIKWEGLHKSFNNMTLGIHSQEWAAEYEYGGSKCDLNEIYLGFLFFRFIFQFIK